jgi:hypothetical protein
MKYIEILAVLAVSVLLLVGELVTLYRSRSEAICSFLCP